MPVMWAAFGSSAISAGAPLLMAVIGKDWPYWYDAFFAQVCFHFYLRRMLH